MERKVVQDIVPTHKRTIRNIPARKMHVEEDEPVEEVPIRRTPASSSISRSQTRFAPEPSQQARRPAKVSPSGKRRLPSILLTFLVIFIGIAVIAVALSLLYSKAAVTITPKTASMEINGTFTAKATGDGSLVYETVMASSTMTQNVPATDGPLISTKAKGAVTLYNEQTIQQRLVAGTRLANTDGEVYRTSATVVIPAGKTGAPGTVVAAVLADQAGAQYNMSLANGGNFKVVAYEGTPKYTTVYAKLKTAITGGNSGQKKNISAEVQSAAVASLKESLITKLVAEAKSLAPKDSILYDNAYTIEFDIPEPVAKDATTADIVVKGTLTGAAFKEAALLKSIAAKELDKFPAPTYSISGMQDLKFTVVNSKDFSPRKGTPLIFSLKGPVNLTGTFSEIGLKNELKGTYLKDSNAIFAKYPSIANAYALITPFWMRSFPNSAEKIILEIKK